MKKHLVQWTMPLLAATLCAGLLQAADLVSYRARFGSKVTLSGSSSIHDWKVNGLVIAGNFKVEPAFTTDLSLKSVASLHGTGSPSASVLIPISSLKSDVDVAAEKMDEVMQEAMKAKAHPYIRYSLKKMTVKGDVPASGTPVKFDTEGQLSIAGVTKPIKMEITMDRLPGNKLKFSGSEAIKMTDFGIAPPKLNLGPIHITTEDKVTIKFAWLVGLRK